MKQHVTCISTIAAHNSRPLVAQLVERWTVVGVIQSQ